MRDMRRMRINVLATALGIVIRDRGPVGRLGFRILLLLPVLMSFWFLFYMPGGGGESGSRPGACKVATASRVTSASLLFISVKPARHLR